MSTPSVPLRWPPEPVAMSRTTRGSRHDRPSARSRPRSRRGWRCATTAAPFARPTTRPRSTTSGSPARPPFTTSRRPTGAPSERSRRSRSRCCGSSGSRPWRAAGGGALLRSSLQPRVAARSPRIPHADRGPRAHAGGSDGMINLFSQVSGGPGAADAEEVSPDRSCTLSPAAGIGGLVGLHPGHGLRQTANAWTGSRISPSPEMRKFTHQASAVW